MHRLPQFSDLYSISWLRPHFLILLFWSTSTIFDNLFDFWQLQVNVLASLSVNIFFFLSMYLFCFIGLYYKVESAYIRSRYFWSWTRVFLRHSILFSYWMKKGSTESWGVIFAALTLALSDGEYSLSTPSSSTYPSLNFCLTPRPQHPPKPLIFGRILSWSLALKYKEFTLGLC